MASTVGGSGAITVTDVARLAGVSVATAARALGDYGSVSARTRERVQSAAAELGYSPNMLAKGLITKTTRTIGVIVADIENPFFLRALRGITSRLNDHGYDVLLANTDEDAAHEQRALQVMASRRVDGIILTPTEEGESPMIEQLIKRQFPIVLLDRRLRGVKTDFVGIRNRSAARHATEYLLDQGHRRIALVSGAGPEHAEALHSPDPDRVRGVTATTLGARTAGYREALAEAGIDYRIDYVTVNGFRREDAIAATNALLDHPEPPTALIALDSVLSLGVMQALHHRGVACPDAVSVIGFDDAEWTEVINPPLTVMSQPGHDIGRRVAERLVARLNGGAPEPESIRLAATLIPRGSVGPPPGMI